MLKNWPPLPLRCCLASQWRKDSLPIKHVSLHAQRLLEHSDPPSPSSASPSATSGKMFLLGGEPWAQSHNGILMPGSYQRDQISGLHKATVIVVFPLQGKTARDAWGLKATGSQRQAAQLWSIPPFTWDTAKPREGPWAGKDILRPWG